MSTPKSVTKVLVKKGKTEVSFENNLDATQYYIHELNRAALRDVGKYVKKMFQVAYDRAFKKRTGNARKSLKIKVYSSASTTAPRMEIGIKAGDKGFYSLMQEFGSSHTPRLGLLQSAVKDNVAEIIKIESQYLSALEGEANSLEALINESDMEVDDE